MNASVTDSARIMSFRVEGLLYRESIAVAELNGQLADWDVVGVSVIA